MVVKAKLIQIISNPHTPYAQLFPGHNWTWTRMPTAAKFLRLGFHDCLKYSDDSGGCDGCLNWHNVGYTYNETLVNTRFYDDIVLTDNNGLGRVVETLEGVYTNKDFPQNSPSLNISLRESGKSRADLWALAAIVGVEYGIETNNAFCDDPKYSKVGAQCHHEQGKPDCKVNLSGPIQFRTGRADCITSEAQPYITYKEEAHPSIMTNGEGTIEFFKRYFNFTGRETVAILGGHTLGRLNVQHSLLPYVWTSRGGQLFNNHYYKLITNKDEWYFNDDACTKVGDAFGNIPKTRWVPHVRQFTKNGGPVHWIHENYACPNCVWDTVDNNMHLDCCTNKPADTFCRPDNNRNISSLISDDDNVNWGCEYYRFIVGLDEMVLSAEMGLYKKFDVVNNTPTGCVGLEDFTLEKFKEHDRFTWPLINGVKAEPQCPFQDLAEPAGSEPLHTIFEEFADNQDNWVRDFKAVFEKMLSNGYGSNLVPAPDQWTNVTCSRPDPWSGDWVICHKNLGLSGPRDEVPFYIESLWTSNGLTMVIQMNETTGKIEMWERVDMQANQLWRWSMSGDMLINVATNTTLNIQNQQHWKFVDGRVIGIHSNYAIDCFNGNNQVNGSRPVTYTNNGAPWQLYQLRPSVIPPIETTGKAFYIESGWTGNGLTMVIQQNTDTGATEMWEKNGNLNQLWKWAADGQRIINEQSNKPLVVQGNEGWNLTDGTPYGAMNVLGSTKCIDCFNGNTQVNGSNPITWDCNGAPWQKYRRSDGPLTTTNAPPTTTKAPTTTPATTTTPAPTTTEAPTTTTPQCIEPNTFYGGRPFATRRSTSSANCRGLCVKNRRCRSFVWYSPKFKKRKLRNKCQLKNKAGKAKKRANVHSGLKRNC